jgi:hypothetical protein
MAFFLRTAFLFLIVGYASHLVLDHFSSWDPQISGKPKSQKVRAVTAPPS